MYLIIQNQSEKHSDLREGLKKKVDGIIHFLPLTNPTTPFEDLFFVKEFVVLYFFGSFPVPKKFHFSMSTFQSKISLTFYNFFETFPIPTWRPPLRGSAAYKEHWLQHLLYPC